MTNIADPHGRKLGYLRVSVTDRCNFRCKYCMPQHHFEQIPSEEILRHEDIIFTIEALTKLGVEKVRITGGEPLVRKGLPAFLKRLVSIPGIKDVGVTTNGALLKEQGGEIFQAGVHKLNISLDSLREDRFNQITGGSGFGRTIEGIKYVSSLGFSQLKVNCVAIRKFNDDEIIDFCNFAAEQQINVRFIEFMPIGNSNDWNKQNIITGAEIVEIISKNFDIQELPKENHTGPAVNYKLSNGAKVGVITPMSQHFCDSCDKIRLTADGKFRPCLLSDSEVSVLEVIRNRDADGLIQQLSEALGLKNKAHDISTDQKSTFKRTMSKIGG